MLCGRGTDYTGCGSLTTNAYAHIYTIFCVKLSNIVFFPIFFCENNLKTHFFNCLTKTVKLFRDVKNFGLEIEMEIFRTPWNFINIYPNLIELERENITAEYWFVITKNCLGFIISVVWSWQCHKVFMWQK